MCYKKFDKNGELNCGVCRHYHYEVGMEDTTEECDKHLDMCEREDCEDWVPKEVPHGV